MQYFETLPKVIYNDPVLGQKLLTNLMARVSMMPQTLQNPLVFYPYDIQEGDTPEIIAYKYYGDSYKYWMVLFANQIMDPQWQWPIDNLTLDNYLSDKYPNTNVDTTIHHYLKTVTSVDNTSRTSTITETIIDLTAYNALARTTRSYTLPNGSTVTVTTDKSSVNIYDYEMSVNEKNRSIRLINAVYADQLEKEFQTLMAI
jgi:hypothetical protein